MPIVKINMKAIALLAGAMLLVILAAAGSIRAFRQIEERSAARDASFTIIRRANASLSALKDAETSQRGYLLTGQEDFLAPYRVVRDSVMTDLDSLRALTQAGVAREHADSLERLVPAKLAELAEVMALYRAGDAPGAMRMVATGRGKRYMDAIRRETGALIALEEGTLAEQDAAFRSSLRRLFSIIMAASLAALLLALLCVYLIERAAAHRLRDVMHKETARLLAVREETNRELERSIAAVQMSEAKLAVTLNCIGDAVVATDIDRRVTLLNPHAERLTGWSHLEAVGRPMDDVLHIIDSETNASVALPLASALTRGTEQQFGMHSVLVARDGSQCAIEDSCAPIRDGSGELRGAVMVFRDVTVIKRYERTLQQKNDELETASRTKSEFLANMSHELRTPLNAIIGFSEALMDGLMGSLTEKQRGFIADIFESGSHLLALINDILDLSKVEAGKMSLDLEPVPVRSFLAASLGIVRESASRRGIALRLEADDDLGACDIDTRKVKQIVYNLLANAVKFSSEGGEVVLRASRVPRGDVGRLTGAREGRTFAPPENEFREFLELSVTDDGIGIAPGGLEKLFSPFSQIDSGLSRKFEGTGLGLAMVRQLAELHGGSVAVESTVGHGSSFIVWLPFRASGVPAAATAARRSIALRADALPGQRTALVVEDDEKSAELIRLQLEAEGFTVLHADTAEAALVLAARQPLSLITLDIQLPTMDGWEFLGLLKRVPALRYIPVMIISIVAERHQGFALGAAAVLQKPLTRQELSDSLKEIGLLPVAPGDSLRVLVVDDDPKAAEVIALRLEGLATSVMIAHGGREAIEIAGRELPDLLVLDLMMPEVNGFEVVAALQLRADTARIPVLVVTAKEITADDRDRLHGYATAVMEKAAFDPARFIAEVRRATGRTVEV